jgi:DNA modification methylase
MNTINRGDFRDFIYPENALTVTDPPYNVGYHYEGYSDKMPEDDYIEMLKKIPRPVVCIHYPEDTINILPRVWGRADEVVCWVYPSNTGKQSRLISWWGCKPDFRKEKQPYKNPNDKRIKKLIESGSKGSRIYDWWEINQVKNVSDEKTDHPCQIPLSLLERIIRITAVPGQVIADPFAGSGGTGVAANNLGHHFWGCEIVPKYQDIITGRVK